MKGVVHWDLNVLQLNYGIQKGTAYLYQYFSLRRLVAFLTAPTLNETIFVSCRLSMTIIDGLQSNIYVIPTRQVEKGSHIHKDI